MTERFRINGPHVVAETLDGEATIVDLDSGTYYALNESGSLIWDGLTAGAGPREVAQGLASAYQLADADAEAAVEDLLERLTEAGLLVSDGGPDGAKASANGGGDGARAPSRPYETPELTTYTDMQELLLLDPIHEVDEAGWPARA